MTETTPNSDLPVDLPIPTSPCWRCDLPVPEDAESCPHCRARPRGAARRGGASRSAARDDDWPVKLLLASYAVILLTGIVHAAAMDFRFGDEAVLSPEMIHEAWTQIAIIEAVDSLIIAAAYAALIRTMPSLIPESRGRLWVWFAAAPGLMALLALNFGYHMVLRDIVQIPIVADELMQQRGWLPFVAVCIQPAVIEEIYCRGLALGILRRYVGRHGAVWISAVMFGLMHLTVALSIPYLILVGAFLGYMRLASGTIWLPVCLHFTHNLVVLLYEWK